MITATAVVADTQVLIGYVLDPERLSAAAVTALEGATEADEPIYVSAHSLGLALVSSDRHIPAMTSTAIIW